MNGAIDILARVRQSAERRILVLPHALRQMARPDRQIRMAEVRSVVVRGKVIEDYPEDVRGHSCLMLGYGVEGRAIHIVCSPKEDFLAIITAYVPDPLQWDEQFCRRI